MKTLTAIFVLLFIQSFYLHKNPVQEILEFHLKERRESSMLSLM